MADISREEAIERLNEMRWEIGSTSIEYWSDKGIEVKAVIKAINDMEKLQKIESVFSYIDVAIRSAMCTNPMANDRGCDGGCRIDEDMYMKVMNVIDKEIVQILKEVE